MPNQPSLNTNAILPPDFIQVKSNVPGVTVYAPKLKSNDKDRIQAYACPNCGANVAYDIAAGGIACEYCGYIAPVRTDRLGRQADEFEFTLETLSQADRGWGEIRQVLHCNSCGAELSIPKGALTATCPFCASNQVNVTSVPDDKLRPKFLIPFKITPEQTRQYATAWLGKGWFHPNELATSAIVKQFVGIYLPFWTFDTQIDAHWKAQVGYEKTVRHYNSREKRWESRTKIVWRWEEGDVHLNIDDFLVSGSSSNRVSHRILQRLHPFQLEDLIAYDPDILAGWRAQAFETPLTDAWEIAKTNIREKAKDACYSDIPTNHIRNFSMKANFSDESWRYILLPVYLAAYKYEDAVYQIMVNGQTGVVAGQKPIAWWKIWLTIGALLAPGLILGFIGIPTLLLGGAGIIPIGLGILLFFIGAVIGFFLYQKARESEAK